MGYPRARTVNRYRVLFTVGMDTVLPVPPGIRVLLSYPSRIILPLAGNLDHRCLHKTARLQPVIMGQHLFPEDRNPFINPARCTPHGAILPQGLRVRDMIQRFKPGTRLEGGPVPKHGLPLLVAQAIHHSQQKIPEDDEAIPRTTAPATGVGRTEHFLKDRPEVIPVDPFADALQMVACGQRPALLVLFKQMAFAHLVAPCFQRKGNDLFVMYSESQTKRKCQNMKACLKKNVGNR